MKRFFIWLFTPMATALVKRQNVMLQLHLEAKSLECELLAELNEDLRKWVMANTAAAFQVGKLLGVKELK